MRRTGRRRARNPGQVLEGYLLVLAFVVLPLLVALPAAVAAIQGWMGRVLEWWNLPVP